MTEQSRHYQDAQRFVLLIVVYLKFQKGADRVVKVKTQPTSVYQGRRQSFEVLVK